MIFYQWIIPGDIHIVPDAVDLYLIPGMGDGAAPIGFLRSETSLIQTIGRAARNAEGLVILYADTVTPSMRSAMDETERRRKLQDDFNRAHGIVPRTIRKSVREMVEISHSAEDASKLSKKKLSDRERAETIARLEKEMKEASRMLEFEYAALLRDQIIELRGQK